MSNSVGIGIVGAACRLPGAPDEAAFLEVLNTGTFTVSDLPEGRWHKELFFHPNQKAAGGAYIFAGGFLPNPYDFDIGVFGMSPREAIQVDPQQRLLAELVWEALENARIAPSSIAGKEVGVYIGVSALDHANLFGGDPGAIESHFMSGNTLSIVANRISYLFDLKGPSLVIDTACSSSLVAVDRAVADIRSGRVDMAIVGGVNMLLSPASFVGFSRAQMLSPTGACRPFSAKADGYVRSEGGVVFVLQREDCAVPGAIRAMIAGSAVNSDGRTSGIALPGLDGQRALLERAYDGFAISPKELSFVEAHGTGTAVGDPIEAIAIGTVLAQQRSTPLPIGSVKSNIGHLEPASGVAGMMKALLALEQRRLPRTLHLETLSTHIDFEELNLQPADQPVDLGNGTLHCGVSSFGFGGTNAHVVMSSAPPATPAPAIVAPDMLVLSSHCKDSLAALAAAHADRLDHGMRPERLADAVAEGRGLMRQRAVLPMRDGPAMARALRTLVNGTKAAAGDAPVATGVALPASPMVCFVYNGNGSQWAGMGRQAYAENAAFRSGFDAADAAFAHLGFDSLVDLLHAEDLADCLGLAAIAQPLIFAIQHGTTSALVEKGLGPAIVLGHSVGEIAAAHAAGAITLDLAARILAARAHSQEAVHGAGSMAVLAADREAVARMIDESGLPDLSVAADNAPGSVTISGSNESLAAFMKLARGQRVAGRQLDIEYPYHSPLLTGIKQSFLGELRDFASGRAVIPMVSTVTGALVGDDPLDSEYWWQNIRHEVQFHQAVRAAAEAGANLFVEIGPRMILASAVTSVIEAAGITGRSIHSLADTIPADPAADPFEEIVARAIANGFEPIRRAIRPHVDRRIDLPTYPWQRRTYAYTPTSSAIDLHGNGPRHPLIGGRLAQGMPEWRNVLDARLVPYLADHVVGGEVVVPATALAEMALAVARQIWPIGPVAVEDFDIVQALVLPVDEQREISVRFAREPSTVEIHTRPRFGADEWALCARGRIASANLPLGMAPEITELTVAHEDFESIYRKAVQSGIEYGPHFSLLRSLRRQGEEILEATLDLPEPGTGAFSVPQVLHPASLDASFHALFDYVTEGDPSTKTWLPIRFERLTVWQDGAQVHAATIRVDKSGEQLKTITLFLFDGAGALVARLDRALLRAVAQAHQSALQGIYHLAAPSAGHDACEPSLAARIAAHFEGSAVPEVSEGWLLLQAHMRAAVAEALAARFGPGGRFAPAAVLEREWVEPEAREYCRMLLAEALDAGLLQEEGDELVLTVSEETPDAALILASCAAEFPEAAADIALSAQAADALPDVFANRPVPAPRAPLILRYETASLRLQPMRDAALNCVDALPRGLHVVIADPHGAPLISALADRAAAGAIRLSVAVAHSVAAERLKRRLPRLDGIEVIDLSGDCGVCADLVLACTPQDAETLAALGRLLRPGGALVMLQPTVDNLAYFQRGPSWDAAADGFADLAGSLEAASGLVTAGCFGSAEGGLLIRIARSLPANSPAVRLIGPGPLMELIAALVLQGVDAAILQDGLLAGATDNLLWFSAGQEPVDTAILSMQGVLLALRAMERSPRLWIVKAGGADVAALRAFARVAMNEFADLDIRFVAVSGDVGARSEGLASLIARPGQEREYALSCDGAAVSRMRDGLPLSLEESHLAKAIALHFPRPGMLENFHWIETDRPDPGPGEISVELIATGLNFRDVMLAMGLLGDDVLDEGLAGAVYGLECAGRVLAVGAGVTALCPGDMAIGFGQNSFASHLVAPAQAFVRLPAGLSVEAGAGIPVAFFTAWYSLVELARLSAGEKVLIHGGAGGVGLAAIQIAHSLGAEVIATVSSPDKAALARLFGARHVYDSRSLDFVDQLRELHDGVDVVLNSLSGDAMRGSIKCLRPRGRFIELGKRDYVANSLIALRPFRRNLSYFGVDVDQILALDPALTAKGLEDIARGFADGIYLPLPTMVYRSSQIAEAFRLMQSAGHVGKIVIAAPPRAGVASLTSEAFVPDAGVQLIAGGTRGFGLATALWLAGKGAKKIVVASRSGTLDDAFAPQVETLRDKGVAFVVEALDITDLRAVETLVDRVVAEYGPISGIYHTAVSLQDGMIDNLEADALRQVLAPKVSGAENLHRATLQQPIKQFVLFSSASALIGNPGQGAYAAANGYLEGLARRRRAEGLPALAVQWGAIADVGLLAARTDTLQSLGRIAGVTGMRSADALARLEKVLALGGRLTDPVITISDFAEEGALFSLPVPSSPAFATHFSVRKSSVVGAGKSLAELIADKSDADAHRLIVTMLAEEAAQIMRLATQDVDLDASLDSLGMDSLMALELRMSIETKYRLELPLMAISAVGNLKELAQRILVMLRNGEAPESSVPLSDVESALIVIHGGEGAVAAAAQASPKVHSYG